MRRREFIRAIGGVVAGLACCDVTAVCKESKEVWKHANGRKAYWIGRKGLWTEPVNWSNQRVPDENTDVVIGRDKDGCGVVVVIPADTVVLVRDCTVQDDAVLRMDGKARIHGNMTLMDCTITGSSTITMCC